MSFPLYPPHFSSYPIAGSGKKEKLAPSHLHYIKVNNPPRSVDNDEIKMKSAQWWMTGRRCLAGPLIAGAIAMIIRRKPGDCRQMGHTPDIPPQEPVS
jgi:hypothetical protein